MVRCTTTPTEFSQIGAERDLAVLRRTLRTFNYRKCQIAAADEYPVP